MSNWRLGWRFIKGIDILPHFAGGVAAPQALHGIRGIFSFLGKRISPFDPQEKGIFIASEQLEEVRRLPIALPARGFAALALLYDLTCSYYPLPLCSSCRSAA